MSANIRSFISILKDIQQYPNKESGLCHLVDVHTQRDFYADLYPLFSSWKHFTGDLVYPVPRYRFWKPFRVIGNAIFSPKDAFETMSRWEGSYGDLRKDLLKHMISELEKQLLEEEEKMR